MHPTRLVLRAQPPGRTSLRRVCLGACAHVAQRPHVPLAEARLVAGQGQAGVAGHQRQLGGRAIRVPAAARAGITAAHQPARQPCLPALPACTAWRTQAVTYKLQPPPISIQATATPKHHSATSSATSSATDQRQNQQHCLRHQAPICVRSPAVVCVLQQLLQQVELLAVQVNCKALDGALQPRPLPGHHCLSLRLQQQALAKLIPPDGLDHCLGLGLGDVPRGCCCGCGLSAWGGGWWGGRGMCGGVGCCCSASQRCCGG